MHELKHAYNHYKRIKRDCCSRTFCPKPRVCCFSEPVPESDLRDGDEEVSFEASDSDGVILTDVSIDEKNEWDVDKYTTP